MFTKFSCNINFIINNMLVSPATKRAIIVRMYFQNNLKFDFDILVYHDVLHHRMYTLCENHSAVITMV